MTEGTRSILEGLMTFMIVVGSLLRFAGLAVICTLVAAALVAVLKRRWIMAFGALAVASSPFFLRTGMTLAYEQRQSDRMEQLATLPRTALSEDYPRVLETDAWLGPEGAALWIASGHFDVVRVHERGWAQAAPMLYRWRNSERCADLRAEQVSRPFGGIDEAASDCVWAEPAAPESPPPDAVIYLSDHSTTLKRGNKLTVGSIKELRLRVDGRDRLVDVWELREDKGRPGGSGLAMFVWPAARTDGETPPGRRLTMQDFILRNLPASAAPTV